MGGDIFNTETVDYGKFDPKFTNTIENVGPEFGRISLKTCWLDCLKSSKLFFKSWSSWKYVKVKIFPRQSRIKKIKHQFINFSIFIFFQQNFIKMIKNLLTLPHSTGLVPKTRKLPITRSWYRRTTSFERNGFMNIQTPVFNTKWLAWTFPTLLVWGWVAF